MDIKSAGDFCVKIPIAVVIKVFFQHRIFISVT